MGIIKVDVYLLAQVIVVNCLKMFQFSTFSEAARRTLSSE